MALPSDLMLNHFAYGLLEERARQLVSYSSVPQPSRLYFFVFLYLLFPSLFYDDEENPNCLGARKGGWYNYAAVIFVKGTLYCTGCVHYLLKLRTSFIRHLSCRERW